MARCCTTRRAETPCCRTPAVRAFLAEWGAIYERFGVPADIGLAQVILESGLNGTRRSEANAVGFCQWLQGNWKRLNRLSPTRHRGAQPDDAGAVLRGVPVGARHQVRIVHSRAVRAQRRRHERRADADQRRASRRRGCARPLFSGLEAGPRPEGPGGQGVPGRLSDLWSPLVPVCGDGVRQYVQCQEPDGVDAPGADLRDAHAASDPAGRDHHAGHSLSADEVRRFNPALVERVPAQATLYLPVYVSEFGPDVSFWRRPPSPAYAAVLDDFIRLDAGPERWDDPAFAPVLTDFSAGSERRTRRRDGDGHGAGVCDGPGVHQQPARPPVRVPEQRDRCCVCSSAGCSSSTSFATLRPACRCSSARPTS